MSRDIESTAQFFNDALRGHIKMTQHDQRMKPQASGFINQIIAIAASGGIFGRNQGFRALFAHLLQNLVQTLVIKAGDIRGLRRGLLARSEYLGQFGQYISVIHGGKSFPGP